MDTWNIDKKLFLNSDLNILSYLILYLLHNNQNRDLLALNDDWYHENDYTDIITKLSLDNYIHVEEWGNVDTYVLTSKGEEIFKEETQTSIIKEIIDTLNKHSNSKYRYNSTSTIKHLNARLKVYSKEEIIETTKFMCKKWKGSEMEQYLRPDTLYNETKFQAYFNEWYRLNNKETKKKGFVDLI